MVDIELVQEKLRALEEYIRELETYQCLSREKLESSKKDLWAVEHGLQLAIECILDIGNHIIADERLGNPTSYREIVEILGRSGVISPELTSALRGMAGFRNILIHEYLKVDINQVHRSLQEGPPQFKKFVREILDYAGIIQEDEGTGNSQ